MEVEEVKEHKGTSNESVDKQESKQESATELKHNSESDSGTGSTASVKRAKRTSISSQLVEPRTPLKRQRVPVERFQSPAEEIVPKARTGGSADEKEIKEVLFKKGHFLTVRSEAESFYLCKALQNVLKTTESFRIQWLSLEQNPNIYRLDYLDNTERECILTQVRMERVARDTYRLPFSEQLRAEGVLKKALNLEKGIPIEEEPPQVEVEKVEQDETKAGPSQAKKAKVSNSSKKAAKKTNAKEKKTAKVKSILGTRWVKGKPDIEKPARIKKGQVRDLRPNPDIKILEMDPFFESKENVPFISKPVQAKLAIRAVLSNDMTLLKSLRADHEKVYELLINQSEDRKLDALSYAIQKENKEMITLLQQEFSGKNERMKKGKPHTVLIKAQDTGQYNPTSLGVHYIRAVATGRGGKEGNNALIKDLIDLPTVYDDDSFYETYLEHAVTQGVSMDTLKHLCKHFYEDSPPHAQLENAYPYVLSAVLRGHRKLAGWLVELAEKAGGHGFNALHKQVLLFEKEDLKQVLPASVRKKAARNLTPLHCAAINPNVKYLNRLLEAEPDVSLPDRTQRTPIHYAAVCSGTGPLELLINKGGNLFACDIRGQSAIHYACIAGRSHNVDLLIKKAKASDTRYTALTDKYGPAGINMPQSESYCPIHIAAEAGHVGVVSVLIKHKADLSKAQSARKDKKTALMHAAAMGHLDICKLLIENGVPIEQLDKLKRSALVYAVLNGNTHVASYLLHMGADPERQDSSGNTVVHYAAAYGWWFCLKLLIEQATADPNASNDWKVTPVAIAFLKGHIGLVDYLLKQKGVDINFRDDQGQTLVSIAAASPLVPGLYDQLKYLIDKGADCNTIDVTGCNALHVLARNKLPRDRPEATQKAQDVSLVIAELLMKQNCDASVKNEDEQTPLMLAIEENNVPLARLLVEQRGGSVSMEQNAEGKTVLHLMAEQCMQGNLAPLLRMLASYDAETKNVKSEPEKSKKVTGKSPAKVFLNNGDIDMAEKSDSDTGKGKKKSDGSKKPTVTVDKEKTVNHNDASNQQENGDIDVQPTENKQDNFIGHLTDGDKPGTKAADPVTNSSSNTEILIEMAKVVDKEGFTPLLRSSQTYKEFSKEMDMQGMRGYGEATKKVDRKALMNQQRVHGRDFIQALIDIAQADVNATVQKKYFVGPLPVKEQDHYAEKVGLFSSLHFLSDVEQECPGCDLSNSAETKALGLDLLLKYQPQLDPVSLSGMTPLTVSLKNARSHAAELLLRAGANANFKYQRNEDDTTTPLLLAASSPTLPASVLQCLLAAGARVTDISSTNGMSPIHCVLQSTESCWSKLERLRVLVNGHASVNATDKHGRTPLHLAVNSNSGLSDAQLDIEEFLIENDANLGKKDSLGRIPLHYAFVKINKDDIKSALDPVELCSVLTSKMSDQLVATADNSSQTPLHRAAFRGATICCMHLLQRKAEINRKDGNGNTPLALSVMNSHDGCAIMLIQKNACVLDKIVQPQKKAIPAQARGDVVDGSGDVKELTHWKWRPLRGTTESGEKQYSVYQGAVAAELPGVAHLILDVPTDTTTRMEYSAAVEAALCVNKLHVALRLMKRLHGEAWNMVNDDGRTLLHTLTINTDPTKDIDSQIKIADLLLSHNVSLTRPDKFGCTPLIYCALKHNYKLGHHIIDHCKGHSLNHLDNFGRNAMAATFWDVEGLNGGNEDVKHWLEKLGQHGFKMDLLCDYPVPDSVLFGYAPHRSTQSYFKSYSDLTISPLIVAISNCEFDLVKFMLQHGATVNFADSQGQTPVMHAVRMNDILMVKLLLSSNYDPDNLVQVPTSKPALSKKLSRQLFTIQPEMSVASESQTSMSDKTKKTLTEKQKINENDASDADTDICDDDDSTADDDADDDDDVQVDDEDEQEEDDFDEDMDDDSDTEKPPRLKKIDVNSDLRSPRQVTRKKLKTKKTRAQALSTVDIELTSSIDLAASDTVGWTVIHHLVCPLQYGTYDNEKILQVLHKVGAPLQQKDLAGLSALDHALIRGAPRLATVLQELTAVDKEKMEKPSFLSQEINDGITLELPQYDVNKDAEIMMDKLNVDMETEECTKLPVLPDSRCSIANVGEVLEDLEQAVPYDITLNKVDVGYGSWGRFNFYRMQLVRHKAKDMYVLFTCWGRIGHVGQYQHTPFTAASDAIKEFCKIFKSKTGNEWSHLKNFTNHPKKYHLVAAEYTRKRHENPRKIQLNLSCRVQSRLPSHIHELMSVIMNAKALHGAVSNTNIDTDVMPLGHIYKETLIKAQTILQKIAEFLKSTREHIDEGFISDAGGICLAKISKLSNEYFHLIPPYGFQYETIEPLYSTEKLHEEFQRIANLLDYELATKVLLGAAHRVKEVHSVDYVYQALGCHMQLMNDNDTEAQYILKYIYNSDPSCKVEAIYRLSRPGEEERLRSCHLNNHRLLWHGTDVANMISILQRGLQVAPPEASITGHAFGRGIYTSDAFAKSHAYCHNSNPQCNSKLALLCEIALGKSKTFEQNEETDNEYQSLTVQSGSTPDATFNVTLPYGPVIPLGPSEHRRTGYWGSSYNEYIVYKADQICLRYLIQFRD